MTTTLFLHANLLTCDGPAEEPLGFRPNAAVLVEDGWIIWIGPSGAAPHPMGVEVVDLAGRLLMPGLIDCHTHLVYGGDRAEEYGLRLSGVSYEEVAARGGGILSSVRATRSAGAEGLAAAARRRLGNWLDAGFTTIEIKSGYGLDDAGERAMLAAARMLTDSIDVHASLLAAHALPPEFRGRPDEYIDWIIDVLLPDADADSVDAFCETVAFSADQVDRLFAAARDRGLPVRLHADQLSDSGGAALAARHGALSADHLEHANADGIAAMAAAGTVAVLLPAAYYTLRQNTPPPVAAMRAAGVRIAVATDHNPGTAPILDPLLALNMAVNLFRLTPAEALMGMTAHAAAALAMPDRGRLRVGMRADLAAFEIERPIELIYWLGDRPKAKRWRAGIAG